MKTVNLSGLELGLDVYMIKMSNNSISVDAKSVIKVTNKIYQKTNIKNYD